MQKKSQRFKLAQQIAAQLATVDGITAIALGGSLAREAADSDSDIDMGIYYNHDKPPSLQALCQLASELDESHDPNLITAPGAWGPWINGGGWLKISSCPVDWLYRDNAVVSKVIEDCCAGKTNCYYQPGHPHGFHDHIYLGEIYYCQSLYNPKNILSSFKERIQRYPQKLKETLIQKYLWEAAFSLKTSIKSANRNEIFYVTGSLFRSIACLIQVLFALNECYFINEKGALNFIDSFPISPKFFKETISSVMATPGSQIPELLISIEKIEKLVLEITKITM